MIKPVIKMDMSDCGSGRTRGQLQRNSHTHWFGMTEIFTTVLNTRHYIEINTLVLHARKVPRFSHNYLEHQIITDQYSHLSLRPDDYSEILTTSRTTDNYRDIFTRS